MPSKVCDGLYLLWCTVIYDSRTFFWLSHFNIDVAFAANGKEMWRLCSELATRCRAWFSRCKFRCLVCHNASVWSWDVLIGVSRTVGRAKKSSEYRPSICKDTSRYIRSWPFFYDFLSADVRLVASIIIVCFCRRNVLWRCLVCRGWK